MENVVLEKNANQVVEDKMLKYKKQKNIELYKSYRVFSFDLLFYYAIIYLFLSIEKGLTTAQILQFDAFYILFKSLVQIPSTIIIQKIGKRKSIIFASVILAIHMLFIIFAPNFNILLVSQFLCALGYTIKATCETDMLYDSIEHGEKRGSTFAKIDGKATARHYYIEAISAVIAGFLFVVNPYVPMVLSFLVLLWVAIISTKFEEIQVKEEKFRISEQFRNLKYSFRNIFHSKRLISLLVFNCLMVSMIKIMQNLRNTVLLEIGMPEKYFGVIFAVLGIISGIATKNQDRIHKRYRNKTLTFLAFPTAISCLLLGIFLMFDINIKIMLPIVLILFTIQYITKGPYYVLIKRYLNNFTNGEKRVKIATVNNLMENLIVSILIFGASSILNVLKVDVALIIIGSLSTIAVTLVLDKMRYTVGLKPDEYSKKEIL